MARGSYINSGVNISYRFGYYIVTPKSDREDFSCYDKVTCSKSNTIIGHWSFTMLESHGGKTTKYRDYIGFLPCKCTPIKKTDKYLFFKPINNAVHIK